MNPSDTSERAVCDAKALNDAKLIGVFKSNQTETHLSKCGLKIKTSQKAKLEPWHLCNPLRTRVVNIHFQPNHNAVEQLFLNISFKLHAVILTVSTYGRLNHPL